jgi:hypothetical protein
MKYLIRSKGIPVLEVKYPELDEEAHDFVSKIVEFLKSLPKEKLGDDEKVADKEPSEKET